MPRWLTQIGLRLRSLFQGARVERELDEEFRYHLEREIEERLAAGLTLEEARFAARRSLGASAQSMEECRDMRRVTFVEHRIQDLRFAGRQLRKHPGFAATAMGMLALGLCANVAIFGFVDAALLRPLPYQQPWRLVTAFGTRPDLAASQRRGYVSYLNFLDWRARNRAFRSIAAYDVRAGFTLTTSTGPQRVSGLRVTSGFFRTLGVTPVLGREFHPDEEGPAAAPTVVLAYNAWQTRFGARPDALGETVTLQGEPHVVIGVLPPDFHFTLAEHADFWATVRGTQGCWDARRCRSLETVARLADGVSVQTAAADLDAIVQQLRAEYPDPNPEIAKLVTLREVILGDVRPVMLMLLSGAGLLLLIAGINVVSLLIAHSDSRTREIAVRNALGASSARLVLQFATEALVLVAAGTVVGLMLASWGMRFLSLLLSPEMISRMPYLQGIGLNGRLAAFACALSLAGAVVFTLTPVMRVSVSERLAGLKEGSRGSAGTTWRRLGSYLVVGELAIAVILLVSAGLLGKSLYRLLHVDTGFNTQQLATLSVTPVAMPPVSSRPRPEHAEAGEAESQQPGALARQVADRVRVLPGIQAVGYADLLPLGPGLAPTSGFQVAGRAAEGVIEDHPVRRVSAGYFTALQATLLRGRCFTEKEVTSARRVAIVNATAAQRYFPGEDPIGRSIVIGAPPAREIVGIVADIKDGPPETPASAAAYVPFDHVGFALVVRTSGPERSLFPSLVAAIREAQPDLLVEGETTMTERMNRLPSASLQRATAWLVGSFAGMALLLSLVGLYGVVAYSVGQRTREIGVRMALGAERLSVYRLVVGESARLVGVGAALGMVAAVAVATLMRGLLFSVQSWDAPTLATAAVVLIASALLASFIPARRAASVNPIEVLRAE
jgi:macrolide transport system ATP-binding/permease protein